MLLTGSWLFRVDPINVSKCPYPDKCPFPIQYAHGLLHVTYIYIYIYIYEFLVYSYHSFTHILKGCFIGTSPMVRLLLWQWYIVCIFWWMDGNVECGMWKSQIHIYIYTFGGNRQNVYNNNLILACHIEFTSKILDNLSYLCECYEPAAQ